MSKRTAYCGSRVAESAVAARLTINLLYAVNGMALHGVRAGTGAGRAAIHNAGGAGVTPNAPIQCQCVTECPK